MIGVFDSGSGGLTVLSALHARAPQADITYFGDIKHAPYGLKTPKELEELTNKGIETLRLFGATQIVAACNSVSATILAQAAPDIPIIEMSEPTARALKAYAGKSILLIATPATISSGVYQRALNTGIVLDLLPISDLAGAIEFGAPKEVIEGIIETALALRTGHTYDALLLGCTHFPLVRTYIEPIAKRIFGSLSIVDPADAVAEEVVARFDTHGSGTRTFVLSEDSQLFRDRVMLLFPGQVSRIVVA